MFQHIRPAVKAAKGDLYMAILENVRNQAILLAEASPVISKMVQRKELIVVGGIYHLATGGVTPVNVGGASADAGFVAGFDPIKQQIVFAFKDKFSEVECYTASAANDLAKFDVLSRTQSYVQRTDGYGSQPDARRFGRNILNGLSRTSMSQSKNDPVILQKLDVKKDRIQLHVVVSNLRIVEELKESDDDWQIGSFRVSDEKRQASF